MKTAMTARMIAGIGNIIGLVIDRKPATAKAAIIHNDLLGHAASQRFWQKIANSFHITGQQVNVVQTAHAHTAPVITLGDVFKRRAFFWRRNIFVGVVINLKNVPVGIGKLIGAAMAQIAINPANAAAKRFDGLYAALQRFWRCAAIADMANASGVGFGQL